MIHLINWIIRILLYIIVSVPIVISAILVSFVLWDDKFIEMGAIFMDNIFMKKK